MALIAEGTYACYITDQGLAKLDNGKQYAFFAFEVAARIEADGSRTDRKEGVKAPTGKLQFWLTDAAFDNSHRDIQKILGRSLDSFSKLDPRHPLALSICGKEVTLYCKHEEYKGQTQAKWGLPRAMGKPLAEEDVQSLDERLKRKLEAASSDLPPEIDDDLPPEEVPF